MKSLRKLLAFLCLCNGCASAPKLNGWQFAHGNPDTSDLYVKGNYLIVVNPPKYTLMFSNGYHYKILGVFPSLGAAQEEASTHAER